MSVPEERKKTRTSKVGIAQRQRREIPVQGQGVSKLLISAADRETFNGSRSEIRVNLMSCWDEKTGSLRSVSRSDTDRQYMTASSSSLESISFMVMRKQQKICFPDKD